jgi:DNA-directed RNA polymerase specialized sigma24 family protein
MWVRARKVTGSATTITASARRRKIDSFRGDATFGSWVYRIVVNAAYQCCRRRRRREADNLLPAFDGHGRHVAPVADWSYMPMTDECPDRLVGGRGSD